jgi:hypothetical protein
VNQSSAELVLSSWPNFLKELNRKLANSGELEADIIEDVLTNIEMSVTTSLNVDEITRCFHLSKRTAEEVVQLANVNQHHHHEGNPCPDCFPSYLPSNLTMMTVDSDSDNWECIKNAFKEELAKLPKEMYGLDSNESLEGFLVMLKEIPGFRLGQVGLDNYRLKLPGHPDFDIKVDEIFRNILNRIGNDELSAVFHRSMSCSSEPGVEFVLKRPLLKNCQVLAYHPLVLLAAKSRVQINICGKGQEVAVQDVVSPERNLPEEEVWLIDPKKKLIKRNTKTTFVNTNIDKRLKIMKPTFSDPLNNFIDIEDGKELKIIKDMHDMYL